MFKLTIQESIEKVGGVGKRRREFIDELIGYDDNEHYVHFSNIEKFGINPQTKFGTPAGIYGYPLSYVIDAIKSGSTSEFGFDRKYLHIFRFKPNAKVITFTRKFTMADKSYDDYELADDVKKIKQQFNLDQHIIDELYNKTNEEGNYAGESAGAFLWGFTYFLLTYLDYFANKANVRRTIMWAALFRFLGIDGFVDQGNGLIHPNERYQAVAFGKSVVEHVAVLDNNLMKGDPTPMHNIISHKIIPNIKSYNNTLRVYNSLKKNVPESGLFATYTKQVLVHAVNSDIEFANEEFFADILSTMIRMDVINDYYGMGQLFGIIFLFPAEILNKHKDRILSIINQLEVAGMVSRKLRAYTGAISDQTFNNFIAFFRDKICPEVARDTDWESFSKKSSSLQPMAENLFELYLRCQK